MGTGDGVGLGVTVGVAEGLGDELAAGRGDTFGFGATPDGCCGAGFGDGFVVGFGDDDDPVGDGVTETMDGDGESCGKAICFVTRLSPTPMATAKAAAAPITPAATTIFERLVTGR